MSSLIKRVVVLLLLAKGTTIAAPEDQQPNYQPDGSSCAGNVGSLDPVYAKVAASRGGHFLFDKSEDSSVSPLTIAVRNHNQTLVRAEGNVASFLDIPVWVDSSVESLLVAASTQCMQTIDLYDPDHTSINSTQPEAGTPAISSKDNWYRSGRIRTLVHPQPGRWVVRIQGTGQFLVAVQAKSQVGIGDVTIKDGELSAQLDTSIPQPFIRLMTAAGDPIGTPGLIAHPEQPERYEGRVSVPAQEFRVQVEWISAAGERVQRTDPRLFAGSR